MNRSSSTTLLELDKIGWAVGEKQIVSDISLNVHPGEMVGIIGPNGSGKSSLLRCIYRFLQPTTGVIFLKGVDLAKLPLQETARQTAVVLQERRHGLQITVLEAVLMGRTPHKKMFEGDSADDYSLAMKALQEVDLVGYATRSLHTLSGGEVQRVYLARSLCQQAELLILDEPTNHLDIAHQLGIMSRIRQLSLSSIAALHDLNMAAAFCDRICVLYMGRIVAAGSPETVLTEKLIKNVYGVDARVQILEETGQLNISFLVPEQNSAARSTSYRNRRQTSQDRHPSVS